MKKVTLLFITLIAVMWIGFPTESSAASKVIKVYVNGEQVKFDKPPFTEKGTSLVQFKPIFEKLGIKIKWDAATWTITGTKPGLTMKLTIGKDKAIINGVEKKLSAKPRVVGGYTFVPLKFVGEATGAQVEWNQEDWAVEITQAPTDMDGEQPAEPEQPEIPATEPKALSVEEVGKLTDRVVYIEVLDRNGTPYGTGSGFVVSSDGKIVTNQHVIDKAAKVRVVFYDGKEYYTQKVLNIDASHDLALIQLEGVSNLPAVQIGDSSKLKIGEQVVAIGSPLGYQNTVSTGIVSAMRTYDNKPYIQVTTPIDHGSSGGALLNMHGEVVGITSNGVDTSTASLNFAIPSSTLKEFLAKPQQPIILSSLIKSVDPATVKQYLIDNWSTMTYTSDSGKVYRFDLEYVVLPTSNDKGVEGVNMGVVFSTEDEYWNTRFMHLDSEVSLAAFILKLADEVNREYGVEYVFGALNYAYYSDTFDSTLPAKSQKYENGRWFIWHPVQFGAIDFKNNTGYFVYDPYGVFEEYNETPR